MQIVSMSMGAALGFAAHRAGLCTVKAVVEVVTTRRAHFLWSFAKSSLWVMVLAALAATIPLGTGLRHWPASGLSVLGGVLFGVGAAINGGCTFSTLSRLMDGNLHMLVTVLMWLAGMLVASALLPGLHDDVPTLAAANGAPPWLLVVAGLLLARELVVLVRRALGAPSLRRFATAPVYSLSAAAAVLGIANGVLLIAWGPWSFTGTLLCTTQAHTLARCGASQAATPLLVLAAALLGMFASSWQRRSFRLQRPQPRDAMRHALGGLLMGVGAMLIPGGNDGLILFAMPSLSPHAIPAYAGMLAGIAAALLTMRALGQSIAPVVCQGDICRTS